MKRGDFIKFLGINAFGAAVFPSVHVSGENAALTVKDLHNYLRSLYKIEGNSVDQIIIGNPDARVKKIGTCWMPYWDTLKEAAKSGVDTIVAHEPTFYTHLDLKQIDEDFRRYPDAAKKAYMDQVEKKKRWIEANKISIIRCHDVPDILPRYGIPYAFGMALGFSNDDIIRSEPYYNVYRTETATALSTAKKIAFRLSAFGQQGVAFYGDENRMVSSIGLGTGAICDPVRFAGIEADLRIAIDDSVKTWTQTYFAHDTGNPLIIINHGTAEEYGIRILNAHLKEVFKNIDVIHFNQGCGYRWIS